MDCEKEMTILEEKMNATAEDKENVTHFGQSCEYLAKVFSNHDTDILVGRGFSGKRKWDK